MCFGLPFLWRFVRFERFVRSHRSAWIGLLRSWVELQWSVFMSERCGVVD